MLKVVVTNVALFAIGCAVVTGCGDKPAEEAPKPEAPPALGVLELPVALRTRDAMPSGFRKLEIGLSDMRVDDQVVLGLENGRVAAADRQGDIVPKLKAALTAAPGVSVRVHSGSAYETAVLALSTASSAGMRKLAFEVRAPGNGTTTGWLTVDAFSVTPRSDDDVKFDGVVPRKWDEFAAAWQGMNDACSRSPTGSCAYVESRVAQGGNLKIVLHASGQGVNLDFHRVGLTAAELAAEEVAWKAEAEAKKEPDEKTKKGKKDKSASTDIVEDIVGGPPASDALFQFRAPDAVKEPSVLAEVMKPLCGTNACGAVVSADSNTLMVRVVSLIGAAFADGTASPTLAFEMPWTEKPKPLPPVLNAVAPAVAAPNSATPGAPK